MTPLALLLLVAAVVLIMAGVRGESLVTDLGRILRGGK